MDPCFLRENGAESLKTKKKANKRKRSYAKGSGEKRSV